MQNRQSPGRILRSGGSRIKLDSVTTDPINIAHIPVAGIGGLGLVALAAVVAWNVPQIATAMTIAVVAGGALAIGLIVWHRRA